jgi:hypothetical protein
MGIPDGNFTRKVYRRMLWQAFWRGFTFKPLPSEKELSNTFWKEVTRLEEDYERRMEP